MAYDNKPNLNNRQFEQLSGDTINLSGITQIYGQLKILNTTGFSSTYNAGTGKVWTSNAQGAGTWETPSIGITGATSLGSGYAICGGITNNNLCLKSISGGTGISMSCTANQINICGTSISGTANYVPIFNATGNNICNSIMKFVSPNIFEFCNCGANIIRPIDSVSGASSPNCIVICGGNRTGDNTKSAIILSACGICLCQSSTQAAVKLFANTGKGFWLISDSMSVIASTQGIMLNVSNSGYAGDICFNSCSPTNITMRMGVQKNLVICGYGGTNIPTDNNGCNISLCGGDAYQVTGTSANGGNIVLASGLAKGSGVAGGLYVCRLSAKTTETNILYINSAGRISSGATSSGTAGITGATNGLSTASLCRICLGGNLSNDTIIDLATYSLKFNNGSVISSGATGQGFDSYNDYKLSGQTFLYVPRRNITCGNLALGYNNINNTLSGQDNTAIGYQVLYSLTTGSHNFGVGCYTLASNTCGSCNIGIGNQALRYGACGCNNIALGNFALQSTCGCNNVGLGNQTLANNLTGCYNIAIGATTLYNNSSGSNNIANGREVLYYNTTGSDNIAMGCQALFSNISGNTNIAIGSVALISNIGGCYNTAFGGNSLAGNTYGSFNTAIGFSTAANTSIGSNNTAIGYGALNNNVSGCYNVAIGNNAGYSETGSSKLHVANCSNCTLICGDFAAKTVRINNNLQVCNDIQLFTSGSGIIMCSPNGTKYCVTVTNAGALLVTAI